MALTTEQRARIVALRGLSRSYQNIAEEVGVSKDSVMKVCEKEDTSIREFRRELVEEVAQSQKLLLRDRLESLGRFAGKLREELDGRSLVEVSTPALSKMYLDTLKSIQDQSPLSVDLEEYVLEVENCRVTEVGEYLPDTYQKSTEFEKAAKQLLSVISRAEKMEKKFEKEG